MSTSVDASYFEILAGKKPDTVTGQGLALYDQKAGEYRIRIWNEDYRINPAGRRIQPDNRSVPGPATGQFHLFAVYCLLHLTPQRPTNDWISEKDLPGGSAFFRGPHTLPTASITARFQNDIDTFHSTCTALNGTRLSMADAAYQFDIVPGIRTAVLYWAGDEDFGPESKLLFDRAIGTLPLDIIYCLAVEVCSRTSR